MPSKRTETPDLPVEVVYYNHWTDFESKQIRALFECIPVEDLVKLKEGETIWLDVEQLSGQVYGYQRVEVVSVNDSGVHSIGIKYKGSRGAKGGESVLRDNNGWHKVHRCLNTNKLLELVVATPLATETGTVLTISQESRKYLEKSDKYIGLA